MIDSDINKKWVQFGISYQDYLDNYLDYDINYVSVITRDQFVEMIGDNYRHEEMIVMIESLLRPDLLLAAEKNNSNNPIEGFDDDNILVYASERHFTVDLPYSNYMNSYQFETLKKILMRIQEYNEKRTDNTWKMFISGSNVVNVEDKYYHNNIYKKKKKIQNYVKPGVSHLRKN